MKNNYSDFFKGIRNSLAVLLVMTSGTAFAQSVQSVTWNFASLPAADKALLDGDTDNWTSNGFYSPKNTLGTTKSNADLTDFIGEPYSVKLKANEKELPLTAGLYFGKYYKASTGKMAYGTLAPGNIRIYSSSLRLYTNGVSIGIANLKKGQKVTVVSKASKSGDNVKAHNLTVTAGFEEKPEVKNVTNIGTVTEDGPVVITGTGAPYIYSITITDADGNTITKDVITGITGIVARPKQPRKGVYNLSGQKVGNDLSTLTHGIYIVDGKKIAK